MRVLYCSDTYLPQVNGVSVVTFTSVAGLRRRGWDVHLVAPRYRGIGGSGIVRPRDGLDPSNVTTLPGVPLPPYPDIRLSWPDYSAVREAIQRFRPDLVHCTTEFVIGRMGQIAARRAGVPIATSYHTDFGKYARAYGVPWLQNTVEGFLTRFHRRAVRTYTPSVAARSELWRMGVESVEVWGRGVDTSTFNPARRSPPMRERLTGERAFTFLHVGRLAAEKSVHVLLDAYAALEARVPPGTTKLVIAGHGPEARNLRRIAPASAVFIGNLDRTHELPALYASADAFVFASTTETLGLVVLEAMSSGLPVIATPAGGVSDHLVDGENGIAFPAHDTEACARAMFTLFSDRELGRRLGAGARSTAMNLTWEAELDRLDRSYRELIEKPAPATSVEERVATALAI